MCSKVKDFLTDDSFINYVFEVSQDAVSCWDTYLKEHPEQITDVEEAKQILLAPADIACDFTTGECKELENRIISSVESFSGKL